MAGDKTAHSVLRPLTAGIVLLTAVAAAGILVWTRLPGAQAQAPKAPANVEGQTKQPASKQPAPKQPVQPAAPRPAPIDRNGVLILIRETLLALDQANKTGNYTVLRDLGSPEFQANTAARLAEIFSQQRKDNVDLSGVAVIDPPVTILPQVQGNRLRDIAGFFPSVPTQVNFELIYAPVNGRWKLFGISVSFGQATPQAPQPPAAAPKQ